MAKTKKTDVEEEKKEAEKVEETTEEKEAKKTKLAELKERAKQLAEEKTSELKEVKAEELKKKVKEKEGEVSEKETLVPMDDYLKASIHLGTRVITPDMRPFVYRRRADGLAVFNTALLDDKIRDGADFLAKFAPKDIIIVCKREAGWKAVEKFAQATGIRAFTKKYPSGILTNSKLETFTEADLIFICDPWLDKNALSDANRIRIPVISICDTNNFTSGITKVIPSNNKSAKSLGMILHLLAKLYVEKRKIDVAVPPIQEFIEGWDNLLPPK
jgi:small subunit ribosomal protein S2